ncbi:hypothetical protein TRVL_09472 [Trypanosoma vivax]|nr:hypothetical protein TRVL_09472 [Trypanosoma vivax]
MQRSQRTPFTGTEPSLFGRAKGLRASETSPFFVSLRDTGSRGSASCISAENYNVFNATAPERMSRGKHSGNVHQRVRLTSASQQTEAKKHPRLTLAFGWAPSILSG